MKNKVLKLATFFLLPIVVLSQNTNRNLSSEKWNFKKTTDSNWLTAKVPGTIHNDLYANKVIPDPFFGTNEKQLQWIENENWEYQTTFSISETEIANQNVVFRTPRPCVLTTNNHNKSSHLVEFLQKHHKMSYDHSINQFC